MMCRVRTAGLPPILHRTIGDPAWTAAVVLASLAALLLTILVLRAWPEREVCAGLVAGPQALACGQAGAAEIAGRATVTDGDTIRIGGTRIRLCGVDAPERRQTCQGRNGDVYECGRDSTAVLNELIRGQPVECTEKDRDRYGRIVAVCRTEAGELNAAMVRSGWAVEYKQFSKGRYSQDQAEAQRDGLGIWSGRFEMPWDWRRHERERVLRVR